MRPFQSKTLLACLVLGLLAQHAWCDTKHQLVRFEREGQPHTVQGRVLERDPHGGLCLQDDQGELYLIQANELKDAQDLTTPFEPASAEELSDRLLEELGQGFKIHTTPHYVVACGTSREYARWVSSLLERLHKAFTSYWSRQGLEIAQPEFPLVVLVYANEAQYRQASAPELGDATGIIGFYSLKTNRVSMYDLTGARRRRGSAGGRSSLREINQMLSRPDALPLVATVVHEATHQVAFNTGMMARFADLPLWLVEGMAVYFEAPDLSSGRGWRGIGKINYPRLRTFQANLSDWSTNELKGLIRSDARIRDPHTAAATYAEAWALNYFLIKQRQKQYRAYLGHLAKKRPFEPTTPEERWAEFEEHFGPFEELSRDFLRYLAGIR